MKLLQASLLVFIVVHFSAFAQIPDSLRKELRFSYPELYAPSGLILTDFIADGHSRESIKNEIAKERKEHIPSLKQSWTTIFSSRPS